MFSSVHIAFIYLQGILLHPNITFKKIAQERNVASQLFIIGILFFMIMTLNSFLLQHAPQPSTSVPIIKLITSATKYLVFLSPFIWFFNTLLIHRIARFSTKKGSFSNLLLSLGLIAVYGACLSLLYPVRMFFPIIPSFLSTIATIWLTYLTFRAISSTYSFSTGKAIGTMIFSYILFIIIFTVIIIVFVIHLVTSVSPKTLSKYLPAPVVTPIGPAWNVYTNYQLRYAINYPKGWRINYSSPFNRSDIALSSPIVQGENSSAIIAIHAFPDSELTQDKIASYTPLVYKTVEHNGTTFLLVATTSRGGSANLQAENLAKDIFTVSAPTFTFLK